MASPMSVMVDLDLHLNKLLNAVLDSLASDPSSPVTAQFWFNTGSSRIKFYDGTAVDFIVTPSSTDTLTNKSIDATHNTVSNLAVSHFAASALSTSLSVSSTSSELATADVIWSAIQTAVTTADAIRLSGNLDCSTNPNYPAADSGESYLASVAGKVGGASGVNVEVGDLIVCKVDASATGNHATVGANWFIIQRNLEAASTTVAGFVRLATTGETATGTDATIAVTPAGLESKKHLKSYTAAISASTGATIAAATHGLDVETHITAELYDNSTPPAKVIASIAVDGATGAVTWGTNSSFTGTIKITGR